MCRLEHTIYFLLATIYEQLRYLFYFALSCLCHFHVDCNFRNIPPTPLPCTIFLLRIVARSQFVLLLRTVLVYILLAMFEAGCVMHVAGVPTCTEAD